MAMQPKKENKVLITHVNKSPHSCLPRPKPVINRYPFTYKIKYYAENNNGDRLYLLKFIRISSNQNVYIQYLI